MTVRSWMRALLACVAGLVLVIAAVTVALLPPRARASLAAADPSFVPRATARGAYHIHTNRSDGTGTIDEVAAAAARAGLQFIVLTDHGDGTRPPLPASRRSGVLVLDAVEISTTGGHYVALGLTAPAPYRLAGEPRDVVEDVRRLGGFGIAAHPDSPKPELRWGGWDQPIDGLEWLNEDTEWRDESHAALVGKLLTYPWRPAETLAALLNHSRTLFGRWDAMARTRRIVGLAGIDAHARIGSGDGRDPYRGRVIAKIPSYDASFRTFSLHLDLPDALNGSGGDASRDALLVLDAIRGGHVYTTLDALAAPGVVGFEASAGDRVARMGDFLAVDGDVEFRASVGAPDGSTMRLVCDGSVALERPAATVLRHRLNASAGAMPAACRLEVGWNDGDRRVTWLVTNPIYLRANDPPLPPLSSVSSSDSTAAQALVSERLPDRFDTADAWTIERDPISTGTIAIASAPANAVELAYKLRDGDRLSQYVALVTTKVTSIARATRVSFRASADKPMRLSVQVRRPLERPGEGERWQRSIYLDPTPRDITVLFDDMRPIPPSRTVHPPADRLHALLFVVDTDHALPGSSGTVRLEDVRFER